jgi:hypothetical protein
VLDGGEEAVQLMPTGGGVVVVSVTPSGNTLNGEARYVSTLDAPPVGLGPAEQALPSVTSGRVWLVERSPVFFPAASVRVREVSYDGTTTAEAGLPAGVFPHAAVTDGLLVTVTGAAVVYDPVGQEGRTIAHGTVLAADAQRVLRRTCNEALRCRVALGPLEAPDAANVTVPPEAETALATGFSQASLSPTGRWVALIIPDLEAFTNNRLAVLDVTTGGLRPAPEPMSVGDQGFGPFTSSYAWGPSGEWLFSVDSENGVTAWNLLDDRVVPIDLDLPAVAAVAVS